MAFFPQASRESHEASRLPSRYQRSDSNAPDYWQYSPLISLPGSIATAEVLRLAELRDQQKSSRYHSSQPRQHSSIIHYHDFSRELEPESTNRSQPNVRKPEYDNALSRQQFLRDTVEENWPTEPLEIESLQQNPLDNGSHRLNDAGDPIHWPDRRCTTCPLSIAWTR